MSAHEWVTIPGAGVTLEGVYHAGGEHAGIIAHPHPSYGGDMHNPVVRAVEAGMQQAGLATLRFNFRGIGESSGTYDHGVGEQDDVRAAAEWLRRRGHESLLIAGYSFGAVVSLRVAASLENVLGVVAVAAPIPVMPVGVALPPMPMLWVLGDRDPYWRVDDARTFVAGLGAGARLEVIPGSDHFFNGFTAEIRTLAATFAAASLQPSTASQS